MWSPLASATVVFLVLYILLSGVLVTLFALRKLPWISLWPVLLFHCVIRIVAEACGLAFGVSPAQNIHTLIAYYIFGAQGQYLLLICTAHFLVAWQQAHWGRSWTKTVIGFDAILLAADIVIIVSAALTSNAYSDERSTQRQIRDRLATAKWMRTAGQAVFFLLTLALVAGITVTMYWHSRFRYDQTSRRDSEVSLARKDLEEPTVVESKPKRPWYGHPVLALLYAATPFLNVRAIWGVLSAAVPDLNVSSIVLPP